MDKNGVIKVTIVTILMSVLIGWHSIEKVFALIFIQSNYGSISSGSYNAFYQGIDVGEPTSLNSVTIAVANIKSASVPINTNIMKVVQLGTDYKSTYPASVFSPTIIYCNPANRCNLSSAPTAVLGGSTAPVFLSASYNNVQLLSNKKYLIGYQGTNAGNKLVPVGTSTDSVTGSCYYEDTANYLRYDDYGDHDAYYINKCAGVEDLYFVINDTTETPYGNYITSTSPDWLGKARYLLSGSGDFIFSGSGYSANMYIDRFCTAGTGSYTFSRQAIPLAKVSWRYGEQSGATVMTDARVDYLDSWVHDGSEPFYVSFYQGEGYNYNSEWAFHNVIVEYEVGMNCTYPYHYILYNPNGSIRVSGSDVIVPDIASDNIIMSPSAPPLSDPIGWLGYQLRQAFNDLFYYGVDPDQTIRFYDLKAQIETKAPFAYVNHVFSLNSAPVSDTFCQSEGNCIPFGGGGGASYTDSSFATLTFDFSSAGLPSQSWNPPTVMYKFFGTLKEFIRVVLWLGFGLYVMNLGHRLFHHYE